MLTIGLDGGTLSLLEPLAERGVMPGLASLMEVGSRGILRSTVPPVTAPAWTSFITGKNPGNHGIYQFFSFDPLSADSLGMGQKSYLAIPGIVVNSTRIPGEKLWSRLDRGGLRQIIINVPMTYPPEPVNGLMITGMLTPPGSGKFTFPPELSRELDDYEIDLNPREKDFSGDDSIFLRRVEEILDKRIRISLKLMTEHPWDFFTVVFTETDRLQHRFFDLLAPGREEKVNPERMKLAKTVERLYRKMDEGITRLVEAAGEGVRLAVLSDHGFGPAPEQLVDLRVLTADLGLAPAGDFKPKPALKGWWRKFTPTKGRIYRYFGFLPNGLLNRAEAFYKRRRIGRQRAILFKMHENIGGVWINLRDASGRATDEKDRVALAAELKDRLAGIRWLGRGIIESVYTKSDLYSGPYQISAPDLVFVLDEEYGILEPDLAREQGELVVRVTGDRPRKKGTHRMEGMYLLAGPNIRKGEDAGEAAIEDMTATILYMTGLPVGDDMDGSVIAGAFEEGYLMEHPVGRTAAVVPSDAAPKAYEPDEEAAIKARLEGIGYLD